MTKDIQDSKMDKKKKKKKMYDENLGTEQPGNVKRAIEGQDFLDNENIGVSAGNDKGGRGVKASDNGPSKKDKTRKRKINDEDLNVGRPSKVNSAIGDHDFLEDKNKMGSVGYETKAKEVGAGDNGDCKKDRKRKKKRHTENLGVEEPDIENHATEGHLDNAEYGGLDGNDTGGKEVGAGDNEDSKKDRKRKKKRHSESLGAEQLGKVDTAIEGHEFLDNEVGAGDNGDSKKDKKRKKKRHDENLCAEESGKENHASEGCLDNEEYGVSDGNDTGGKEVGAGDNEDLKDKKRRKKRHSKSLDAEQLGNSAIEGHEFLDNKVGAGDNGNSKKDRKKKKKRHSDSMDVEQLYKVEKKKKKAKCGTNGSDGEGVKKVRFSDHVDMVEADGLIGPVGLEELFGPDGSEELIGPDGFVRGKRFSKREDKLIVAAVSSYIKKHGLGDEGLSMVLNCRSHSAVKSCWKEIGEFIPWRPSTSVAYRAHVLFERDDNSSWTEDDLEFVKWYVEKHGPKWKEIGNALGKHRIHVKDAWRGMAHDKHKRGPWSQAEYQQLFDLVHMDLRMKALDEEKQSKHGMLRDNICWTAIGEKLSTRNFKICFWKWYNQLASRMIVEGKWANVDDYRLVDALCRLDACCIEDVDWDNLLENRSGDICRKRWNQMTQHIGHHGSKSFPEQVDVLAQRYCPDLVEVREAFDNKPFSDLP